MNLIQEIKMGLYAKYQTTTLWTVDAIPFYLDHVPQSVNYPVICCYHISGNFDMAMPNLATKPEGWDYCNSRFQLSIYGNDKNHVQIEDIAKRLSLAFHRTSLTLGNNCTHIATILINDRTAFWDANQKIWTVSQDYRIMAGV